MQTAPYDIISLAFILFPTTSMFYTYGVWTTEALDSVIWFQN